MQKRLEHPLLVPIYIGLFGAIGAAVRSGITHMFSQYSMFPVGTWIINTVGSFLLSIMFFRPSMRDAIPPTIFTAITVGGIGSFTTFSTVTVETVELFAGEPLLASVYMLGSIFTSVCACFIGYLLVKERA
ncbi:MAG TPA: CrcB family protein [Bacillota bacterium]|nr:CrcB family protein [Bacillota bacterium]